MNLQQGLLLDLPEMHPIRVKDHSPRGDVPSILKWTGSKRSQARQIADLAPSFERYIEPFLGGGAILYMLGGEGALAADIFVPLIDFWKLVRDDPAFLKENYRQQWELLQQDLPGYFYVVRDRFNSTRRPEDLNFLMRTCVNGIVRFSRAGDFNNSFHLSRKGMRPSSFATIVDAWSRHLQGVELRACDYREALSEAKPNDFVYMDPPYAGNKQRYVADLDVDAFCAELEQLNRRGVKWALSFDGFRGTREYASVIPNDLYKRKALLHSGLSAVHKVLNGPIEAVSEALYLNY